MSRVVSCVIECFALVHSLDFLLGLFAVVTLFHFLLRSEKEDESFMTLYTLTAKSRGSAEVRVLFLRLATSIATSISASECNSSE